MKIAQINMLHYGSTGKIMLGIAEVARKKGMKYGRSRRAIISAISDRYFQPLLGTATLAAALKICCTYALRSYRGFMGVSQL